MRDRVASPWFRLKKRLGVLLQHRFVRRMALEIMTEVVHVARKENVRLEKVSGTIDLSFLDRVTFRDRSLAREVLTMFGQQAEGLLMQIADAGDERVRRETAHRLNGGRWIRSLRALALL